MRIPALGSITITGTTRSNVDLASVISGYVATGLFPHSNSHFIHRSGSRLTVSVCSLMTDELEMQNENTCLGQYNNNRNDKVECRSCVSH
jgi:hypothetical protein